MPWKTPEGITAIVTVSTIVAVGALQKLGALKLPVTRENGNGNRFSGMSISDIEKLEKRCLEYHTPIHNRLNGVDKEAAIHTAKIEDIKDRLDKGEEKFDTIQNKLEDIGKGILLQNIKSERREESLMTTLKEATQTMQEILQRLG